MLFKYNRFDVTEKNLYYLSMVSMLNVEIIVNQIFVICAVIMLFQEKQIDKITIFLAVILASFGYVLSGIDALFRKIILRKRIRKINNALNIDMFSVLSGKRLNEKLIYKDDQWFIAVPSPECIIINKNYMRKEIEIKPGTRRTELTIHTNDGKSIVYTVDDKWKYVIDRLKKWMR